MTATSSPLKPPFSRETALAKVQAAEDLWNSKDPHRVARAYTQDTRWRNRDVFLQGRDAVLDFLSTKWDRELDYRLRKELFAFEGNRIAVRFEYEYRDARGQWHRAHGNENWIFDDSGLMAERFANINEHPINASQRRVTPGRGTVGDDFNAQPAAKHDAGTIANPETWTDACGPIPHWQSALAET